MLTSKRKIFFTLLILSIPFVSSYFTSEVQWSVADYIIMGILLLILQSIIEFGYQRLSNLYYRSAFIIGGIGLFLMFWINAAVGILGASDQVENLYIIAVYAVVGIGSIVSKFRPYEMSLVLFSGAAINLSIPLIAMINKQGLGFHQEFINTMPLVVFLSALLAISGILFKKADTSISAH